MRKILAFFTLAVFLMAIAGKGAGAGAATETSGAACSPASPAVVDAGDILIIHAYFEGTTTAPNLPAGFTLLHGPVAVETVGRHWISGKIADGSEDGAANALGSQAVSTMRSGRCYSFSGRVSGAIGDLVKGFASTSHATDPQMPSVTTTIAGALAVACVAQNDNNAIGNATGETGGDWTSAAVTFTAALTPGLALNIQTATPNADPGTISGGSIATTNDPCGVIGFEIRTEPEADPILVADAGAFTLTGTAASLEFGRKVSAESGSYALTGTAASLEFGREVAGASGSFALTGTAAGLRATRLLAAAAGAFAVTGTDAALRPARLLVADSGAFTLTGQDATLTYAGLTHYALDADAGSFGVNGTAATLRASRILAAALGSFDAIGSAAGLRAGPVLAVAAGSIAIGGTAAAMRRAALLEADSGGFAVAGSDANPFHGRKLIAASGSIVVTGSDVDLIFDGGPKLSAESGAFVITGSDVEFAIGRAPTLSDMLNFTPITLSGAVAFGRADISSSALDF